ncbi:MAG: acylphosphatase [Solirubrobacterales bacterium]
MSAEILRRRAIIHGAVQGVFFRDSLRRAAIERGVAGSAVNRADGSVEAVLEGPADAVSSLLELCRTGPPAARVDRVEVSEEDPQGASGFRTG